MKTKAATLVGKTIYKATVQSVEIINGAEYCKCVCACGEIIIAKPKNLLAGNRKACRCWKPSWFGVRNDISGKRFGRLVAIRPADKYKGRWRWECCCDCGNIPWVLQKELSSGKIGSCGCLKIKHGATSQRVNRSRRTNRQSPEYKSWRAMLRRCADKKSIQWNDYGGRGLKVCKRWKDSFESFFADMGPRPKDFTIHRKDNGRGYDQENCIWADWKTQNNPKNKRPRRANGGALK